MLELNGFWSYAHCDNDAEEGRIIELANDIKLQFELISGETLNLIYDQSYLEWGDKWKEKIDSLMEAAAFVVPVLTPRYFRRPECRRELQYFLKISMEKGYKEIVLPILYVEVPEINNREVEDSLIQLIQQFQWKDWTKIRFKDRGSEIYRCNVALLASILNDKFQNLTDKSIATLRKEATVGQKIKEYDSEEPGSIDIMANFEEILPIWSSSIEIISENILSINDVLTTATTDILAASGEKNVYAIKLRIAKQLAHELSDPVENIYSNANIFISQLYDIDKGFQIILSQIRNEDESITSVEISEFFDSIRFLVNNYNTALDTLDKLKSAIVPLENLSKDLRPILQRFKQGLNIISEAKDPLNRWLANIETIH